MRVLFKEKNRENILLYLVEIWIDVGLERWVLIHNNNNMPIVQYPMQFSGPPRNISDPCSALTYMKRLQSDHNFPLCKMHPNVRSEHSLLFIWM